LVKDFVILETGAIESEELIENGTLLIIKGGVENKSFIISFVKETELVVFLVENIDEELMTESFNLFILGLRETYEFGLLM
jgi:hypothetical protein